MKTSVKKDNDLEFRKWCIEQAVRWPMLLGNYNASPMQFPTVESNVLDRAERVYKCVKNIK